DSDSLPVSDAGSRVRCDRDLVRISVNQWTRYAWRGVATRWRCVRSSHRRLHRGPGADQGFRYWSSESGTVVLVSQDLHDLIRIYRIHLVNPVGESCKSCEPDFSHQATSSKIRADDKPAMSRHSIDASCGDEPVSARHVSLRVSR